MTDGQEPSVELQELEERARNGELTPEEQERLLALRAGATPAAEEDPTGVLWEQGPVAQPEEPMPELVSGSPAELAAMEVPAEAAGIPAADPAFDAVPVPEIEEVVPEVSADDLEEIVEVPPAVPEKPAATVSWLDEEEPTSDAIPLDALLASPPPAAAESLAPPLPPPLPAHAPAPPAAPAAEAAPAPPPERDPFAPSASFVSGDHRVVLHLLEGQVLRGSLANADLCDAELPLIQPNGAVARVPASHVKAIFFMLATGDHPPPAAGTRVRVSFGDGRQVAGLSPDYSPESSGFFVLPVDARTNTARVWVYRAATRHIVVG